MKANTNLKEPNPGAVYWSTMSGEAHSGYYLRTIWSYFGGKKSFAKWFTDEVANGYLYEVKPTEEKAEVLAERLLKFAKEDIYEWRNTGLADNEFIANTKQDLLLAGKEADEISHFLFEVCDANDDYYSDTFELEQDVDEFIQCRRAWLQIQYDNWLSK